MYKINNIIFSLLAPYLEETIDQLINAFIIIENILEFQIKNHKKDFDFLILCILLIKEILKFEIKNI